MVRLLLPVVVLPRPCSSENTFREGGTKESGTDNFVPNKTEREKRERAVSLKGPLRQDKLVRGQNG